MIEYHHQPHGWAQRGQIAVHSAFLSSCPHGGAGQEAGGGAQGRDVLWVITGSDILYTLTPPPPAANTVMHPLELAMTHHESGIPGRAAV